jgi:beta-glucuronidase
VIRPQANGFRRAHDLSGIWRIRRDAGDRGLEERWVAQAQWPDTHAIAVPGSWNEQLAEKGWMDHVGPAWYRTSAVAPDAARRVLRFGSADYFASVWVNGVHAGDSAAPMLPFAIDVTHLTRAGEAFDLVVRITNALPENGPTQRVTMADYAADGRMRDEYLPAVRFDFFPFGGLNRPVHLLGLPDRMIEAVRVDTAIDGATGRVTVAIYAPDGLTFRAQMGGAIVEARVGDTARIAVPQCRFWGPADPHLYTLDVTLLDEAGEPVDRVRERIGVREVRVEGARLLLNGEPVTLKGFGKHEDSAVHGRGLNLPLLVKDFALLDWIGANSVRTAHYPYAEEFLDMADEAGVLVIDEAFSINLDFRRADAATLAAHKAEIAQLIARDRNRPCVIAWSLANEPGYLAEPIYREASAPYWAELFAHARALDPTRPLTHANVAYAGLDDPAFDHGDFLSINRYHGWYGAPGQIDRAIAMLRADFDALAGRGKPIFVSEFGADAVAGMHATHDQLFTEEYQADLIAAFWQAIEAHPSVIGGHVWNFADFRTAQHSRRVVHNRKGVFTRARDPKRAAWTLRDLWR